MPHEQRRMTGDGIPVAVCGFLSRLGTTVLFLCSLVPRCQVSKLAVFDFHDGDTHDIE